jgi:hypothetical protein
MQLYIDQFNFLCQKNILCFLLGNSPTSEFYMSTFRNTLFNLYRQVGMKDEYVWKCWNIYTAKFGSSQTFSRINTPTLTNLDIFHTYQPMKMEQSVPKRRHIKFRRREITQKKAYNIQNKGKIWNQEYIKEQSEIKLYCPLSTFLYKNHLSHTSLISL